jgi:hypothetical protein
MNRNGCSFCLALDCTGGLIGVRYPNAYIFCSF